MATVGIDLSLRSTGIVALDSGEVKFGLLKSDPKKHTDEVMLRFNTAQILVWLKDIQVDQIAIEGLSFNAKSASKDLIAANYWYLRMELKRVYPDVPLHILPVTAWRAPLFSKEDNKAFTADKKELKQFKIELKEAKSKADKDELLLRNKDLILRTNIKWLTYQKLPEELQETFGKYGFTKGTFDLTDAYFIAEYTQKTF